MFHTFSIVHRPSVYSTSSSSSSSSDLGKAAAAAAAAAAAGEDDEEESSPSSEADSDGGLSEVEVLGPGLALWVSQVQGLMLKRWLHHYRSE